MLALIEKKRGGNKVMAEGRNKLDALNRENEISELFRIVQSASINRADRKSVV